MVSAGKEEVSFHANIRTVGIEQLLAVLNRKELDFGCRPRIREESGGVFLVDIYYASRAQLDGLRGEGVALEITAEVPPEEMTAGQEDYSDDAFRDGTLVPTGFGVKLLPGRAEKGGRE